MYLKTLTILMIWCSIATATISLSEDTTFFGIPGMSELSTEWLMEVSDTTKIGLIHPVDFEVLKLSPADWRLVALQADCTLFTAFPIDQENGITNDDIAMSGSAPSGCRYATAMCVMTTDELFNSSSDRIAVTFKVGAKIGIYSFDKWTNELSLESSFSNMEITRPIGIYWAFDNFFIVDEDSQTIYRTDESGNILGQYGQYGIFDDGYRWISDICGYIDSSNVAQLYVSDGANERIDHLTATSSDSTLHLESQATSKPIDTLGINLHEAVFIPYVGVVGLNRYSQRLYYWDGAEDLDALDRDDLFLTFDAIHIRELLGRFLVVEFTDTNHVGWKVTSFNVEGASYSNPISYPDTHWTAAMSPVYVTDKIVIGAGEYLTIDAGVEVLFDAGTSIRVDSGGVLSVNGTSNDSVRFHSMDSGEAWAGIWIEGGRLTMSYARVMDSDSACIWTDAPDSVYINSCTLVGNKMLGARGTVRLTGAPSKTQYVKSCVISGEATNGIGLYAHNCTVKIQDVKVRNCSNSTAQFLAVTGNIEGCTFADQPDKYGILFANTGTTPNFQCCTFENIAPATGTWKATIYAALGTAPTFGYTGSSSGVSNVLNDSSDYVLRMSGWTVLPIIQSGGTGPGGRNDWYQRKAAGKYISWGPPYPNPLTAYLAKDQYWNRIPVDALDFSPSNPAYFALGSPPNDPWDICGGSESSIIPTGERATSSLDDDPDEFDSLFAVAMAAEINGDYQSAQDLFYTVATTGEDFQLVWQATTHIVSTQRALDPGSGEAWIPSLIDSLIMADSSAYSSWLYGNRLLASYRLAREEYSDAMSICSALLNSGLPEVDSILVSIDLLGIQMAVGFGDGGGSLDESDLSFVPSQVRCNSVDDAIAKQAALFDILNGIDAERGDDTELPTIPTAYRLYQNYPNPFNPTTQIEFDLPARSRLNIRIYNTLGQEVVTLRDATYPAGHHVVSWNGKSNTGADVATGLYIYQMKAGPFTNTKKMVLLR